MISPKNKRVMITLTEEASQLLNSLSNRYNKSKSEIIKWALYVLASKKNHNLVIKLREQQETNEENEAPKFYDDNGKEITFEEWLTLKGY